MKAPVLALFLSIVLIIAGCGASPAAAPPTAEPTVAPSATPLSEEAALLATIAANAPSPAAATPTVPLPTPFPTITLGPTAEPRPLPEGWWDTAVCYEIFVRSFYDSNGDGIGDINGLIEKLDYINDGDPTGGNDLGATCIWLMPVAEAASYHGFDVIDYYYSVKRDTGIW